MANVRNTPAKGTPAANTAEKVAHLGHTGSSLPSSSKAVPLCRRLSWTLDDGPDFNRAETHGRNPRSNGDGLVEIFGFDQEISAELFAGLGEGSIGQEPFAFTHPDACSCRRWMQLGARHVMAAGPDLLAKLHVLPHDSLLFCLGELGPNLRVVINEHHVFHLNTSVSESNGDRQNRQCSQNFLSCAMSQETAAAVDALYRADWGRIVATLIRLVGDFEVAEDAAQEAFAAAVEQWPKSGVPDFPRAWVIQTARNKAIDRIRRRAKFEEKLETYTTLSASQPTEEPDYHGSEISDDRLRLIF